MANLATALDTTFTATGAFMFRAIGGRVLLKMKAGAGDGDANYTVVGEVMGEAKLCSNDLAGMVYKLVSANGSNTGITVLAWQ